MYFRLSCDIAPFPPMLPRLVEEEKTSGEKREMEKKVNKKAERARFIYTNNLI